METVTLEGVRRVRVGTRHARRIRNEGKLPAIIYGHGEAPESVALSAHEVEVELQHGARVLTVKLEEKETQYLIKSVQYDHLGTTPIHLDLMRVDVHETVTVEVGIELRGTPKGVADGGVLEQHLNSLEVECLMIAIPETLRPSVMPLGIGDSLLVKDLKLPPGVKTTVSPEERVATVRLLAVEVEEEEAPAAEEAAQPEVIGRGKKEEEETPKGGK
ncbi:MAG TPA: 50S ribosomal protein L25 [Phycisphaerae bacterium]|nr:50S ribosomal protein L25 [Phycisphaerae bacterium]